MPDETMELGSYRQLNEDEFELETLELPELPGPRMLVQEAEKLEAMAANLRFLATLWRASSGVGK